jgi:hypothetical protein
MGVQTEEEMSAIRAMQIVTKLWVSERKSDRDRDGCRVSLTFFSCKEYGSCGKKQEPPVQVSNRHPTLYSCLQELLKRLQEKHGKCAEALTKKAAADAPDSISVITSARIIAAHVSTIKTLLSSSIAGSTEWRRMRQDSRSKSGRRTLTHHGHLSLC